MNQLTCKNCGVKKTYKPAPSQKEKYTGLCRTCFGISRGSGNPHWKGRRIKDGYGYIRVKLPNHPFANTNGYVAEHRLIMADLVGVEHVFGMVVHHKDGNKSNNDPNNLELLLNEEHSSFHSRKEGSRQRKMGEINPMIQCECGCGKEIPKFNKHGNPRRFIVAHWSRKNV